MNCEPRHTWQPAGAIPALPAQHPFLGDRLALRGETLLATISSTDDIREPSGLAAASVQVFQHAEGGWTPTASLAAEGVGTLFGYDLGLHVDGDETIATVAAYRRTEAPVLTGAWQYRLVQGWVVDSRRLRNPVAELDGADSSTSAAWFVPGPAPWAALAAPFAQDGPAIRIVEPNLCPPASADLNGDGVVNGADLGILLAHWGGVGIGDLNGDGVVDGADLGLLLAGWT